ncbi:hypothetical protein Taro_008818 [Colocasia esculenta]|uniref:Uncharacterized protein n=1 Tax=Colocasia esculenta TaxID=4460 RepID=A0A843U4K4_COLES|nr:hypothetical protein [Colocasia esculenta]
MRTSRDVMSRRSSRPRHRKVLYFPHRHLWIMEYSCKVWSKPCRRRLIPRQHSRLSWRLRLMAFDHRTLDEALSAACRQEGEMEQYLEEKKASQKRPATTFQRQDKKKVVYQTPQRSVRPQDQGLPKTSAESPTRSASPSGSGSSASYRKTRKASSPSSSMKDYDAILGLDWLEEHYALVDCRWKRIVFRIPGEDEFSHPLPRNLAGKLVISAMKAMRMVNKGCDILLASVASTLWMPTLIPASSDVDANFSDLYALQSPEFRKQATPTIGELSPTEGIPDLGLHWSLLKNPELSFSGSFLGQPKESFTEP